MVATATIAGAFFGLWVQLYSNGVRKLRPSFHPWEHVLAMGSGIVLANGVVHWEHKLKKDLDKLIKKIQKANKKRFLGTTRAAVEDKTWHI
ncbi:unnamed protein product [Sphagnum balticum]